MVLRPRHAYARGISLGLLVALAALAWILTVRLGPALMPSMAPMPGRPGRPGMAGVGPLPWIAGEAQPGAFPLWLADGGVFLVSWVLMTVAMMLPTTLGMVDTFSRLTATRSGAPRRMAAFGLGYLLAWSSVGLVAYLVARALQLEVDGSMWLRAHVGVLSGGALVLAGLYQFTPLKHRCLHICRSPLGFFISHWRAGAAGALRMGARHGLVCIGCCWVLMLLMLAVGMAQLGWMLGLALLMFAEKVVRRGEMLGYGAGLLFVPWGCATALTAAGIPLPHV